MENFKEYKIKKIEPEELDEDSKGDGSSEFAELLKRESEDDIKKYIEGKNDDELEVGKKMKFSKYETKNIQDSIDLHGQSRAEAKISIESFIADCRSRGLSVVQIITGKGEGIINQCTKELLENMKRNNSIKKYKTAPGNLGGEGALIVILK